MTLGREPSRGSIEAPRDAADRIVDEVLGDDVDWVSLVRRYPLMSLGVAAGAGFFLARSHGPDVIEAVRDLASRRVSQALERLSEALS